MLKVDHNYLPQQFADPSAIVRDVLEVVKRGDFTLGEELAVFEREFAAACGAGHAVGVGNGTDAIFLLLRALRVRGQEVITTPFSFYATTAAIVHAGGTPVFADVGEDFNISPEAIEAAITPRTVGIVPVHWAGRPCDIERISAIARKHGLWVVEDCAQALGARVGGRPCGSFGAGAAFSLHPLKCVNVWGDGGAIVTRDSDLAAALRLLRNHGMSDRDTCEEWGFNSRLDTIQAVVARHVLRDLEAVNQTRRLNAAMLDEMLAPCSGVVLPKSRDGVVPNYYLYTVRAQRRDELQAHLRGAGIDAKVHYPRPLHLQPAAAGLGYQRGDFPMAEACAVETLSLPVHNWLSEDQVRTVGQAVLEFYGVGA